MRYEVPQFIEEETKIFGPLTFRQFFMFLGALVISFILFFIFKLWLWVLISTLLFGSIAILAFGRMQGRPLSSIVLYMFRYAWNPRRYIWKKQALKAEDIYTRKAQTPTPAPVKERLKTETRETVPLTPEKIKELASKLDDSSHG